MSKISHLLRFTLPRARLPAFTQLRNSIQTNGPVSAQYFGYVSQNEGTQRPGSAEQMCWYIEWPTQSAYRLSDEFRKEVSQVAEDKPRSLLFKLQETENRGLAKGLEAGICEFAIINLTPNAPRFDTAFEASMHKTFTDCYFASGFTGGGWGYALNSNDAEGELFESDDAGETVLEEKERRLAYYAIGWDSVEDHHAYEKSELFGVEIGNLAQWFGKGTGAFYVKFEKHA